LSKGELRPVSLFSWPDNLSDTFAQILHAES
jgi:hypothetical protein